MPQLGMVIDLGRCVGCGACALACKAENNTGDRVNGQTFNWADFIIRTEGRFPNSRHDVIPVLCNHCSEAACVEACPTEPKSMYKSPEGITLHSEDRCIGCQACQDECPYSVSDVDEEEAEHSVISFNATGVSPYRRQAFDPVIEEGTASGREIARLTGAIPAYRTRYRHPDYGSVRREDVVEKCMLCAHRLAEGRLPACVEACPAEARLFGDLKDPASPARRALEGRKSFRLREEEGTEPNVHYVGSYSAGRSG